MTGIAVLVFLLALGWSSNPWIAGGAAIVAYLVGVQLHPWTQCWWCHEKSKRRDKSGKNWRNCWVCGGSGKRHRVLAIRRK